MSGVDTWRVLSDLDSGEAQRWSRHCQQNLLLICDVACIHIILVCTDFVNLYIRAGINLNNSRRKSYLLSQVKLKDSAKSSR